LLLRNFLPATCLREYIHSISIVHFVFPKGTFIPAKAYAPRPENSLYFFPRDPEYISYPGCDALTKRASVCIHGQHTILNKRYVGQDFLALIVHFQPGVLYRLTGVPLDTLTNMHVAADQLITKEVNFVNEQLAACKSYQEMLTVVESFLIKLVRQGKKDPDRVDRAATYLLQRCENISMHWLASETCLSPRQFERKFKERTGVPASVLARIKRFNLSKTMKNAHRELDLLTVSLHSGYYDYQHMVKDYREFTGLTPTGFFNLESNAPEKIFGLSEENRLYHI
jgi:AraC-like DNA-binding protein